MPSYVTPDDFEIGLCLTVLRNPQVNAWPFETAMESDSLKGVALQIRAINLPYLVVDAYDTRHGYAKVVVDVRDRVFIRLAGSYVQELKEFCKNKQHDTIGCGEDARDTDEDLPF